MAKRPRAAPIAPVTWRDGVHLTDTPIWCDARRRRDVCFVSSADRVGRAGHGQLIGTSITLALLGATSGGHLAVPLRRRFTLGTLRLELIPSGRALGAAALHVDVGGRTVLYAGAIRPPEAEVRSCEAVVVAAPYGETRHKFRPMSKVIDEIAEWSRAQLAKRPVLAVDTPLDALELASQLGKANVPVAASRVVREAAMRIGTLTSLPSLRASTTKEPAVMIVVDRPDAALASVASVDKRGPTALVSGRAIDGHAGHDHGFVWPHAADRAQLLAWVESTSAKEIYVTGACAESIVAALRGRAKLLGPPEQMALFEAVR